MDLAQLEMLVATVEAGGVQKAAERVCRTQPAVSMALRKLERELGAPLFDRSNRGAYILTPTGELLYASAKRMLGMREEVLAELRELHQLQTGRIRIGANESASSFLLPKFIQSFHIKFPTIMVEAYRQNSQKLIQELRLGAADIVFVSSCPEENDVEALPVKEDELVLIVDPEHAFARRRRVHVRDLAGEKFIAHSVRSRSREEVVEAFRKFDTPLQIKMEISSLDTIKKLVVMKQGPAFMPLMCIEEELARGEVVRIRLEGFSYKRTLWFVRRRSDAHSHATQEFTRIVSEG